MTGRRRRCAAIIVTVAALGGVVLTWVAGDDRPVASAGALVEATREPCRDLRRANARMRDYGNIAALRIAVTDQAGAVEAVDASLRRYRPAPQVRSAHAGARAAARGLATVATRLRSHLDGPRPPTLGTVIEAAAEEARAGAALDRALAAMGAPCAGYTDDPPLPGELRQIAGEALLVDAGFSRLVGDDGPCVADALGHLSLDHVASLQAGTTPQPEVVSRVASAFATCDDPYGILVQMLNDFGVPAGLRECVARRMASSGGWEPLIEAAVVGTERHFERELRSAGVACDRSHSSALEGTP